jgi:hypothetical protein
MPYHMIYIRIRRALVPTYVSGHHQKRVCLAREYKYRYFNQLEEGTASHYLSTTYTTTQPHQLANKLDYCLADTDREQLSTLTKSHQ